MYRIDRNDLPCKFLSTWWEYLGEKGMGQCEMHDCSYDGDKEIPEDGECDKTCIAYEPIGIKLCEIHDEEYYENEYCMKCRFGDNAE